MGDKVRNPVVDFLRRAFEDGVSNALMDTTQIGEYGVVYKEGWSPVESDASPMAAGVIHALDVVGVVLHAVSVQGFTGQYIRIPWRRIGFIWSMSFDDALAMIQAGEQPAFVN